MAPDVKRRAVFKALQEFLQGDELLEVMTVWEQRFATRPQFVINEFIDVFVHRLSKPTPRSTIIKTLTTCLMSDEASQWPDPRATLDQ